MGVPFTATLHAAGAPAQPVAKEELTAVLRERRGLLWVDVTAPSPDEMDELTRVFSLHPLLAEDLLHARQRPKADVYEHSLLVVAYGAGLDHGRVVLHEVAMLVGRSDMLSVRHQPPQELVATRERLAAAPETTAPGSDYLLYLVLDELVDTYVAALHGFDEAIERIERMLLSERYERARLSAAFTLRRDLLELQGVVSPMPDLLEVVCRLDRQALGHDLDAELRDVRDHAIKASERLDRYDRLLQSSTDIISPASPPSSTTSCSRSRPGPPSSSRQR
jgi:magnesium transporter